MGSYAEAEDEEQGEGDRDNLAERVQEEADQQGVLRNPDADFFLLTRLLFRHCLQFSHRASRGRAQPAIAVPRGRGIGSPRGIIQRLLAAGTA